MPPKKASEPTPTLLLMCGLPASGKSTFSTALAGTAPINPRKPQSWLRVSADDEGSLDLCKDLIAKQLRSRKSVIMDRCNASNKERAMLAREAQQFAPINVELVYFATPADVCLERALGRHDHPTLSVDNASKVI